MTSATIKRALRVAHGLVLAAGVTFATNGSAAELIPLPQASFTFPSMTNVITDLIVAKEFDKKNGLAAEVKTYGTGGAMFAALAKGELVQHSMSAYLLQKMRSEGAPLTLMGSLVRLSSLQVITNQPDIKSFADLKGRTFAATVAFAEYDYLRMYGRKLGFELGTDVTVVNATPSLARAQLEAKRVDAIMSWEPSSTMIMDANKDARIIVNGDEAWNALAGVPGWQLLLVIRTDFMEKHKGVTEKVLKMYQDMAAFANANPKEAGEIVGSGKYTTKGVPADVIERAIKAGRLHFEVKPAWEPETNKRIWQILQLGVEYKQIPALPDKAGVLNEKPM